MGPTWDPPGSCRPQIGPMLAPWTLLSGLCMEITSVEHRSHFDLTKDINKYQYHILSWWTTECEFWELDSKWWWNILMWSSCWLTLCSMGNTHWGQTGWQIFSGNIFQYIFFKGNISISIQISLQFVPSCPINKSTLVLVMVWCWTGTKPLPEPVMTQCRGTFMYHQVSMGLISHSH